MRYLHRVSSAHTGGNYRVCFDHVRWMKVSVVFGNRAADLARHGFEFIGENAWQAYVRSCIEALYPGKTPESLVESLVTLHPLCSGEDPASWIETHNDSVEAARWLAGVCGLGCPAVTELSFSKIINQISPDLRSKAEQALIGNSANKTNLVEWLTKQPRYPRSRVMSTDDRSVRGMQSDITKLAKTVEQMNSRVGRAMDSVQALKRSSHREEGGRKESATDSNRRSGDRQRRATDDRTRRRQPGNGDNDRSRAPQTKEDYRRMPPEPYRLGSDSSPRRGHDNRQAGQGDKRGRDRDGTDARRGNYGNASDDSQPPRCYNCNEEGHMSRNCRQPCKVCRGRDHTSSTCPKRRLNR